MNKSLIIIICITLTLSTFGLVGCGSAIDEDLIGPNGVIQTGNPTRPRPNNPKDDPIPDDNDGGLPPLLAFLTENPEWSGRVDDEGISCPYYEVNFHIVDMRSVEFSVETSDEEGNICCEEANDISEINSESLTIETECGTISLDRFRGLYFDFPSIPEGGPTLDISDINNAVDMEDVSNTVGEIGNDPNFEFPSVDYDNYDDSDTPSIHKEIF